MVKYWSCWPIIRSNTIIMMSFFWLFSVVSSLGPLTRLLGMTMCRYVHWTIRVHHTLGVHNSRLPSTSQQCMPAPVTGAEQSAALPSCPPPSVALQRSVTQTWGPISALTSQQCSWFVSDRGLFCCVFIPLCFHLPPFPVSPLLAVSKWP